MGTALLDINEAGARLRRPVKTLRDWRLKGVGPRSFKVLGRVMYLEDDIEAFIAEARGGGVPAA